MFKIILSLMFLLISCFTWAQSFQFKGQIEDKFTNESLVGANIFIIESALGGVSSEDGKFSIKISDEGVYTVRISFIGYKTFLKKIKIERNKYFKFLLSKQLLELNETIVKGKRAKDRETPVAFSELSSKDIETRLGSKEAVNILEGTPSAFISQQGGGIGDQRLSIRGFDQTNIAVMINGIPINNPENGEIYWSNWAGISELIDFVQVQRGLSATPYSISSVGGSVNFITKGKRGFEKGLRIQSGYGADNLRSNSVSFSTNLNEYTSISGFVSKRTLDGYADQVFSDEFTYYFSLQTLFGNQSLEFQVLGSPQTHGQRLSPQSINTWANRGDRYNADWGYLNGKPLNLRDNTFHRPSFNINHIWQLNKKLTWTNTLSYAHGEGGGTVPPWYPFFSRTQDGLIDFDKEWKINSTNIDTTFHENKTRSIMALRKGIHKHDWATIISILKYNKGSFTLTGGIDGKIYQADNYNELSNLLGGDYYIGSGNVNDNPNRLLSIGDKVDFNARSFTRNLGGFVQSEYKTDNISAYLNFSISNTGYKRIDYFNYEKNSPKRNTGWKYFTGFTIKAGLNYNIDEFNNVYVNGGNYSKAPFSMNIYDYYNNLYENLKNEKINSFELGYGIHNKILSLDLNYYYTSWKDKAFSKSFIGESGGIFYYNIYGASAEHHGVELNSSLKVAENLTLNGMFSYSSNKWKSDVDAYARPESNPSEEIKYHAYTENLYVGNFPMTTASLGINYEENFRENLKFYFNPIYNFYGRYYSQFDPALRTNPNDKGVQSWRLPDYFNIDLHTGFELKMKESFVKSIGLSLNVFNLLNDKYITDSLDGNEHTQSAALVWLGRTRWWDASFYLNF